MSSSGVLHNGSVWLWQNTEWNYAPKRVDARRGPAVPKAFPLICYYVISIMIILINLPLNAESVFFSVAEIYCFLFFIKKNLRNNTK